MIRVHTLKTCDSCRKAVKWLRAHDLPFQENPIRETPPTESELRAALESTGDIRKLFNTSGQDYRRLGIKDKLPTLSAAGAISLLASNGNLIKRPFLLSGDIVLIGFKAEEWAAALRP